MIDELGLFACYAWKSFLFLSLSLSLSQVEIFT